MPPLSLVYSIADQSFAKTKSLGILNVSLHLAQHLAQSQDISPVTLLSNAELPVPLGKARISLHNKANRGKFQRLLWDQIGVYRAAKASNADWLFLPKGFASFLSPPPCQLAVYVHDTIFDYYRQRGWKMASHLESQYFERSFRAVLRKASLIVTNSEFTRKEVLRKARELNLPQPNVRAVGIGFNQADGDAAQKRERMVVLISRWPHKNSAAVIDFIRRWSEVTGYQGEIDWIGSLPEGVCLDQRADWHHHPRLPEEQFRQLVAEARVLVYYTEYEGFGMPPVEAALNGTCPVYSDIPATREAMLGMGSPFSNSDFESFTRAMSLALEFSGDRLDTMAQTLSQTHQWEKVGNRVVQALLDASKPVLK